MVSSTMTREARTAVDSSVATKVSVSLCSERRTTVILLYALLPWVAVALFAAGGRVALHLAGYAVLVFAVGYALLCAALPLQARAEAVLLAPSVAVLALSALTAFWLRLGLPLLWAPALWLGLAVMGSLCLWRDRGQLEKATVHYGFALVAISTLICVLFFLPGAFNDAVFRPDGSFSWFSIDTQLYHSMVASIRNSEGPPKMAGTSTAELCYHFGPYAVTAAISRLTGIDTADALVRVTRGVEQWALIFSCFGLGTMLSVKSNGKTFGGIMSVAGLFFYGSLLSLLSYVLRFRVIAALPMFFESSGASLTAAGPFGHLFLGVSLLHALGAVTATMGLCVLVRDSGAVNTWRVFTILALPACTLAVHSAGGLYCLGVVAVLLFWGDLARIRSWFFMAIMAGLFLGACALMGYGHAPHAAGAGIRLSQLPSRWWSYVMWFSFGLGFRIISFAWVTEESRDQIAALVWVSFAGLLLFSWVGALWAETERYGIYYLQAVFSIFAFSRMTPGFWRNPVRDQLLVEWLSLAIKGLALFMAAGLLIGLFAYVTTHSSSIPYFRYRVVGGFSLVAFLAVLLAIVKKSGQFSTAISGVIAAVLMVGFLGWVTTLIKYRSAGQAYDVTLTPGEVQGLKRLRETAAPGERFATNKHFPTSGGMPGSPDSYAYGTLSSLPVLLEGSFDGAEETLPGFAKLSRDNDLLFTASDPAALRNIAQSYGVRWLVLRPGTDISLPKPLPSWLVAQKDCGDLKIYRIN